MGHSQALLLATLQAEQWCAEVPLLKDRDFVYREVTQQLPGGIHIIFGQSVTAEEEAQCADVPRPTSVIRGEMGASGDALIMR